jgi:NitT/TauT family transport system substrate-binding protein
MLRTGLSILLCILFLPVVEAAEKPLKKASFLPQWSPQAQFAGYYVAYKKGFYKNHGIDLTILQGGPDRPPLLFLTEGKTDFASSWLSTGLRWRSSGHKVINICQIVQRSALMLIAKKSHHITTPQDMDGKKVSLWGDEFQIQPRAFFRKYDLKVEIVPQSFSVNLFLRDGVDVASATWYNEYHTIINSGLNPDELTPFFFDEHGLNFPEDGIYTLEESFKRDPSLSCAFVNASIEGWVYAFSHHEEALDIVLRFIEQAKIPANRTHQRWMLNRMRDLTAFSAHPPSIVMLQQTDYQKVSHVLNESGVIETTPEYESFFVQCDKDVEK